MKRFISLLLTSALITAVPSSFAQAQSSESVSIKTRKIVTFHSTVSSERIEAIVSSQANTHAVQSLSEGSQSAVAVEGSRETLDRLAKQPEVARIDDDIEVEALARVTPEFIPWNISRIGADKVWPTTVGAGIKVAVVDTGIDLDHPDLAPNIAGGKSFVRSSSSPDDDSGHGSNVAGVIAAAQNGVGVAGGAPRAQLYAVKVLDRRGVGYISDIIAGIDWAVEQRVDVINLSLGASINYPPLHDAIRRAHDAGIVIVAAAGNTGKSILYPAAYPEVIAVGMTDDENEVERKSSRGPELDLVAPGDRIESDYKKGKYKTMSGTSMAAPHVSAAAALLRSQPQHCDGDRNGSCSGEEVKSRLGATATDLLASGWDSASGAGLLNIFRALQ